MQFQWRWFDEIQAQVQVHLECYPCAEEPLVCSVHMVFFRSPDRVIRDNVVLELSVCLSINCNLACNFLSSQDAMYMCVCISLGSGILRWHQTWPPYDLDFDFMTPDDHKACIVFHKYIFLSCQRKMVCCGILGFVIFLYPFIQGRMKWDLTFYQCQKVSSSERRHQYCVFMVTASYRISKAIFKGLF